MSCSNKLGGCTPRAGLRRQKGMVSSSSSSSHEWLFCQVSKCYRMVQHLAPSPC